MLSIKHWNNKASDIKLVSLYSIIISVQFLTELDDSLLWQPGRRGIRSAGVVAAKTDIWLPTFRDILSVLSAKEDRLFRNVRIQLPTYAL